MVLLYFSIFLIMQHIKLKNQFVYFSKVFFESH